MLMRFGRGSITAEMRPDASRSNVTPSPRLATRPFGVIEISLFFYAVLFFLLAYFMIASGMAATATLLEIAGARMHRRRVR